MFQFILIDDEEYVLDELSRMMDWGELGFELVATFTDGFSAAEFIHEHPVDVILSDINMSEMSGIELTKLCNEKYPNIIVVLISALRDFEYARQAMQYGVRNYLVKPISYSELETTMKELCELLKTRKSAFVFEESELIEKRQNLMLDFLYDIPIDNIEQKLHEADIYVGLQGYPCCLMEVDFTDHSRQIADIWKYGRDGFDTAVRQIIPTEDTTAYYIVLNNSLYKIKLVAISKTPDNMLELKLPDFVKAIKCNFDLIFKLDIEVKILDKYADFQDLRQKELSDAMVMRQGRMIAAYILEEKQEEAAVFIQKIWEDYHVNRRYQKLLCEYLADVLELEYDNSFLTEEQCHRFLLQITRKDKLNFNGVREKNSQDMIVSKVNSYLEEHCEEDITLEEVAKYIGFNANYFSTYFKQCTGEKFIDFLIRYRMDKAKELLDKEDNFTVQQVCDWVGYKSMPHFYKVFRSFTGVTPAQYRRERGENRKARAVE